MKFYVSRSTVIDCNVEKEYENLSDLRNWAEWSPWEIDPEAHAQCNEDGSRQEWKGNLVGEGSMEIVNKIENSEIEYSLSFVKPFKSTSEVKFTLEDSPDGDGVKVTWSMIGNLPFFLFFLKKSMISFISMDYDRGLNMLKCVLEGGSLDFTISSPEVIESDTIYYVGKKIMDCSLSEISSAQPDYSLIHADIAKHSEPIDAVCIYHKFYIQKQSLDLTAGFIVSQETMTKMSSSKYNCGAIKGGRAILVNYQGDYKYIGNAWSTAISFARYKKYRMRKNLSGYEIHKKNPLNTKNPNDYLTNIIIPTR